MDKVLDGMSSRFLKNLILEGNNCEEWQFASILGGPRIWGWPYTHSLLETMLQGSNKDMLVHPNRICGGSYPSKLGWKWKHWNLLVHLEFIDNQLLLDSITQENVNLLALQTQLSFRFHVVWHSLQHHWLMAINVNLCSISSHGICLVTIKFTITCRFIYYGSILAWVNKVR